MDEKNKSVAYIDGANLHKGISGLGWKLDYLYLEEVKHKLSYTLK